MGCYLIHKSYEGYLESSEGYLKSSEGGLESKSVEDYYTVALTCGATE